LKDIKRCAVSVYKFRPPLSKRRSGGGVSEGYKKGGFTHGSGKKKKGKENQSVLQERTPSDRGESYRRGPEESYYHQREPGGKKCREYLWA